MALNQHSVGCAYSQQVQHTECVFTALCPQGYRIVQVKPLRSSTAPYCRWTVNYLTLAQPPDYSGGDNAKEAFKTLSQLQPLNADIIAKFRCEHPPSFEIQYGVRCNCSKDFSCQPTNSLEKYNVNIDDADENVRNFLFSTFKEHFFE